RPTQATDARGAARAHRRARSDPTSSSTTGRRLATLCGTSSTPPPQPGYVRRPRSAGSALAAVDEALQHRGEQLRRARAYRLILLPRAVAGDVQPGRVFLEAELAHLRAGL